jgi:hypothetical protein
MAWPTTAEKKRIRDYRLQKNGLPGGTCDILFHNDFPNRHQKEDSMIVGDRMSHPVIAHHGR